MSDFQSTSGPNSVPTPRLGESDYVSTPTSQTQNTNNNSTIPGLPSFGDQNPYTDPSYLAFSRGAGYSASLAQAKASQAKQQLDAQLESQKPVWAQNLATGQRNALYNAAGRGITNSSVRLQDQANVGQQVAQQEATAEQNNANQKSSIDLGLQDTYAQLANQDASQQQAAQQRAYQQQLADYQTQLMNSYLNQLYGGVQQ